MALREIGARSLPRGGRAFPAPPALQDLGCGGRTWGRGRKRPHPLWYTGGAAIVKSQGPHIERAAPIPPVDHLAAGRTALKRGDWAAARLAFEAALQAAEGDPEALEGLGLCAWWLDLADVVFDTRERAYRAYLARGDNVSAARVAIWIAWDCWSFRGEDVVGRGWLGRARRLLEDAPDCTERAWLELRESAFCLFEDGDPRRAQAHADEGVKIASALGDIDREMMGRALQGLALVTLGEQEAATHTAFRGAAEAVREAAPTVAVGVIAGADHFYTGARGALLACVEGWLRGLA